MSEEQRTAVTGTGVHARPKMATLGKREKQTNSQKTRRAEELLESLRQEVCCTGCVALVLQLTSVRTVSSCQPFGQRMVMTQST